MKFHMCLMACLAFATTATADTVTFEGLLTSPDSFYNGEPALPGWTAGEVFFNNEKSTAFEYWEGWSYSNVIDVATPGFENQYASAAGGGSNGSGGTVGGQTYAVAFENGAYFNLPEMTVVRSADVTNATYAKLSMENGDGFAKKFGGDTGNDPDFFTVTFEGFSQVDKAGTSTGTVELALADFRFADNAQDFILSSWQNLDLTGLGSARSVALSFASSDVGSFGVNTPKYLALDNLTIVAVPEPSTGLAIAGLAIGGWVLRRRQQRDQQRQQRDSHQAGTNKGTATKPNRPPPKRATHFPVPRSSLSKRATHKLESVGSGGVLIFDVV
ncbi:hypothetical protein K227x_10080 [Rubripirellula lacrimiformis]|uniref:Ice-binding protein C-terminal domain-containing protein n=1 Tax=Rubripirellula lacrimiformis TaxID=1930273 RepID=A0A517N663_9BACT|nr:DUF4465 domain-containing protein [Rubripirellula lacrimiformis]QDT02630.1 hypothetical protein K227x_10080 [Rubripirellula lacrimiformis]